MWVDLTEKIGRLNYGSNQEQLDLVEKAVNAFSTQADLFIDSWASAKTDFSLTVTRLLQIKRHTCRNLINHIHSSWQLARRQDEGYDSLNKLLIELLQELESFIVMIATSRRAMLRGDSEDLLSYHNQSVDPNSLKG